MHINIFLNITMNKLQKLMFQQNTQTNINYSAEQQHTNCQQSSQTQQIDNQIYSQISPKIHRIAPNQKIIQVPIQIPIFNAEQSIVYKRPKYMQIHFNKINQRQDSDIKQVIQWLKKIINKKKRQMTISSQQKQQTHTQKEFVNDLLKIQKLIQQQFNQMITINSKIRQQIVRDTTKIEHSQKNMKENVEKTGLMTKIINQIQQQIQLLMHKKKQILQYIQSSQNQQNLIQNQPKFLLLDQQKLLLHNEDIRTKENKQTKNYQGLNLLKQVEELEQENSYQQQLLYDQGANNLFRQSFPQNTLFKLSSNEESKSISCNVNSVSIQQRAITHQFSICIENSSQKNYQSSSVNIKQVSNDNIIFIQIQVPVIIQKMMEVPTIIIENIQQVEIPVLKIIECFKPVEKIIKEQKIVETEKYSWQNNMNDRRIKNRIELLNFFEKQMMKIVECNQQEMNLQVFVILKDQANYVKKIFTNFISSYEIINTEKNSQQNLQLINFFQKINSKKHNNQNQQQKINEQNTLYSKQLDEFSTVSKSIDYVPSNHEISPESSYQNQKANTLKQHNHKLKQQTKDQNFQSFLKNKQDDQNMIQNKNSSQEEQNYTIVEIEVLKIIQNHIIVQKIIVQPIQIEKIIQKPIFVEKIRYFQVPIEINNTIQQQYLQQSFVNSKVYESLQIPLEIFITQYVPIIIQKQILLIRQIGNQKQMNNNLQIQNNIISIKIEPEQRQEFGDTLTECLLDEESNNDQQIKLNEVINRNKNYEQEIIYLTNCNKKYEMQIKQLKDNFTNLDIVKQKQFSQKILQFSILLEIKDSQLKQKEQQLSELNTENSKQKQQTEKFKQILKLEVDNNILLKKQNSIMKIQIDNQKKYHLQLQEQVKKLTQNNQIKKLEQENHMLTNIIKQYKKELTQQTIAVTKYKEMLLEGDEVFDIIVSQKLDISKRLNQLQLRLLKERAKNQIEPDQQNILQKSIDKENKQILQDVYQIGLKNKEYQQIIKKLKMENSQLLNKSQNQIQNQKNISSDSNQDKKLNQKQNQRLSQKLQKSKVEYINSTTVEAQKLQSNQLKINQFKNMSLQDINQQKIKQIIQLIEQNYLELELSQTIKYEQNQKIFELQKIVDQQKILIRNYAKNTENQKVHNFQFQSELFKLIYSKLQQCNLNQEYKCILIDLMKQFQRNQNSQRKIKINENNKKISENTSSILKIKHDSNKKNEFISSQAEIKSKNKISQNQYILHQVLKQNQQKIVELQDKIFHYQNILIPNLKNQLSKFIQSLEFKSPSSKLNMTAVNLRHEKSPIQQIQTLQQNFIKFKIQSEKFRNTITKEFTPSKPASIFQSENKLNKRSSIKPWITPTPNYRKSNPLNLETFMKQKQMGKIGIMTIMLRLVEAVQLMIDKNKIWTLHPRRIFILNFNQEEFEDIQIGIENSERNAIEHDIQLFIAPELQIGDQENNQSILWNLGIIFDLLINKSLYFSCRQNIIDPKIVYKFENIKMICVKRIIQKLLIKNEHNRLNLENLHLNIKFELKRIFYKK